MASDEVKADSTELASLAGVVVKTSVHVADALRAVQGASSVPTSAFGNSSAAAEVQSVYRSFVERSDTTHERLVQVLEGDADRLYAVAFAYQDGDLDSADRLRLVVPAGG